MASRPRDRSRPIRSVAGVRVLVVTTFDGDEYVVESLRAGASGFLLKDTPPDELIRGVTVIAGGDALLAPAVTLRLIDRFVRIESPPRPERTTVGTLGTHRSRARCPPSGGRRLLEPGDRRSAGGQLLDGQDPCQPPADQARCSRPRPARDDRPPRGDRVLIGFPPCSPPLSRTDRARVLRTTTAHPRARCSRRRPRSPGPRRSWCWRGRPAGRPVGPDGRSSPAPTSPTRAGRRRGRRGRPGWTGRCACRVASNSSSTISTCLQRAPSSIASRARPRRSGRRPRRACGRAGWRPRGR